MLGLPPQPPQPPQPPARAPVRHPFADHHLLKSQGVLSSLRLQLLNLGHEHLQLLPQQG
jgi:hypothetical protein